MSPVTPAMLVVTELVQLLITLLVNFCYTDVTDLIFKL